MLEDHAGKRLAIHIENKLAGGKFMKYQAEPSSARRDSMLATGDDPFEEKAGLPKGPPPQWVQAIRSMFCAAMASSL